MERKVLALIFAISQVIHRDSGVPLGKFFTGKIKFYFPIFVMYFD